MKLFPPSLSTSYSHAMTVTPFSLIYSLLVQWEKSPIKRAFKPLSHHTTETPVKQRQSAGPQGWDAPKLPTITGAYRHFGHVSFLSFFPPIPFPASSFAIPFTISQFAPPLVLRFLSNTYFDRSIDPIPTFLTLSHDKRPMLSQMTR